MYFDSDGLPCQRNGDVGDSCQRVGWIESINILREENGAKRVQLPLDFNRALKLLEVKRGIYVRHPNPLPGEEWQKKPEEFSRDQQSALRKALIFRKDGKGLWRMFLAHACRGFRYQNKDWGMALDEYLRGLVLFSGGVFSPLAPFVWILLNLFDLSALVTALMVCGKVPRWKHEKRGFVGYEDTHTSDDLNLFLDLMLYRKFQSITGYVAFRVYKKRPKAADSGEEWNNVMGALVSYFKEESGGNPLLAEMARPLAEKYFG